MCDDKADCKIVPSQILNQYSKCHKVMSSKIMMMRVGVMTLTMMITIMITTIITIMMKMKKTTIKHTQVEDRKLWLEYSCNGGDDVTTKHSTEICR